MNNTGIKGLRELWASCGDKKAGDDYCLRDNNGRMIIGWISEAGRGNIRYIIKIVQLKRLFGNMIIKKINKAEEKMLPFLQAEIDKIRTGWEVLNIGGNMVAIFQSKYGRKEKIWEGTGESCFQYIETL